MYNLSVRKVKDTPQNQKGITMNIRLSMKFPKWAIPFAWMLAPIFGALEALIGVLMLYAKCFKYLLTN